MNQRLVKHRFSMYQVTIFEFIQPNILNYELDLSNEFVHSVMVDENNQLVEGVQGQWVTPPQAGNNRSKPKCGLFSKINFSCCSTFYTDVDYVPCFIESR